MIKINCDGLDEKLKKGVEMLERYGFLKISRDGMAIEASRGEEISIEKKEGAVRITYDRTPHFYMALARAAVMNGDRLDLKYRSKRLGFMLDCSRNGILLPETVKKLICLLLLAGYDYLELYTEETYELPDEPYFGYKRGRYSTEELREIVAFADLMGFEMIPCIQTLAHLRRLANWIMYYDHMDIDDVLLVGDERTYALIRKMIRHCKDVFHTNRINIGSDEAYHLGRGKYTDLYGYKNKHEVYLDHMKKVFEICHEEGMKPEFWADAFYDTDRSDEEISSIFDGDQTPIVWNYRASEAERVRKNLIRMKKCVGKVQYAGGLFKWQSFAPDNTYTKKCMDALLAVAADCEVDDIIITAWANDGYECSINAMIPGIWYATGKLCAGEPDQSAMVAAWSGYTSEEWELCDKLNYVMPNLDVQCNAAKYLLYNDFIIGLLDYNTPDHADEIYRDLLPKLHPLAERKETFSYLFKSYEALCRVLMLKATFGRRLYRAYQDGDKEKMRAIAGELPDIREALKEFYRIYREQWLLENKGFGFEVMDLRFGGLIGRTETVEKVLYDYIEGRTERIYELEEERLEYFCGRLKGDEVYAPVHGDFATAYTVNLITYS